MTKDQLKKMRGSHRVHLTTASYKQHMCRRIIFEAVHREVTITTDSKARLIRFAL